jgi:ribosomal protein S12 methylthiotransferase
MLGARGVRELCLVAQDTSSYGRGLPGDGDLAALIPALDEVEEIAWVRLLYLYPDGVNRRLLEAMRDSSKVVPYFDVPIQHAAPRLLKKMRRGHGPAQIAAMVKRIRRVMPDAFLRTSVLVGFPSESEEEFRELLDFLARHEFDHLGAFRYSDEEGTASHGTGPAVPPRVSYNRFRKVMALGRRVSARRNRAFTGKVLEVLVEDRADEQGYVMVGRHAGQAPDIDGVTYVVSSAARPGDIIAGRVVRAAGYDLVVEPA